MLAHVTVLQIAAQPVGFARHGWFASLAHHGVHSDSVHSPCVCVCAAATPAATMAATPAVATCISELIFLSLYEILI